MKYRNKFRVSRLSRWFKSSIITWVKGDVPTYITHDVMNRLHNGEREIIIPMCRGLKEKGICDYLNEYHSNSKYWELNFLNIAFELTLERIRNKLSKFSDIDIEAFDISNTDRRIVIKLS